MGSHFIGCDPEHPLAILNPTIFSGQCIRDSLHIRPPGDKNQNQKMRLGVASQGSDRVSLLRPLRRSGWI